MSFSCKKGEFDRYFNRLDRPVEEFRPDRQPDRPVDPTGFHLWTAYSTRTKLEFQPFRIKKKLYVTPTGIKNVGAVAWGERGELLTAAYTICSTGYALAPMLIYPRVSYKELFIRESSTKHNWQSIKIWLDE